MQQYYEKHVTLRGGHIGRGKVKEAKKVNMIDVLSIQE
jgi:hypothetical protein